MADITQTTTLQPSGTRQRDASITSDNQVDIKRAKKAEYNKRYREKQKSKNAEYNNNNNTLQLSST